MGRGCLFLSVHPDDYCKIGCLQNVNCLYLQLFYCLFVFTFCFFSLLNFVCLLSIKNESQQPSYRNTWAGTPCKQFASQTDWIVSAGVWYQMIASSVKADKRLSEWRRANNIWVGSFCCSSTTDSCALFLHFVRVCVAGCTWLSKHAGNEHWRSFSSCALTSKNILSTWIPAWCWLVIFLLWHSTKP